MSTVVTMRQLLEAGVHFGHQTKRGNPKMKKYIFTARNDIHVIDLQKTIKLISDAYMFIRDSIKAGGKVLFIGTKKQAQEAVLEEAQRCAMPYVNQRWLGGTLTNFKTIRKSVRRLKHILKMKEEGLFDKLPAKEQASLNRELSRLEHYLGGIVEMNDLPAVVFIVDTHKEEIAVKEAKKLGIPIVGVVDTNCDPSGIDYPIPANDDAIRSIKLLASVMANAAIEGGKAFVGTASEVKDEDTDIELAEIEKKVEETLDIEETFEEVVIPDDIVEIKEKRSHDLAPEFDLIEEEEKEK